MVDVVLVVAVAVFWFEVPLRGSFCAAARMSLLYVLCTLALGPVHFDHLGDAAAGDDDGDVLLPDADDLPLGVHLSRSRTCRSDPAFTYLIPLRYFLIIVRGIFLKGIGLDLLWPQAAALAAWGLIVLALAVARSRKRAA